MATYGEVQSRIAREIARPDLIAAIPEHISGVIRTYQSTKFWFNEGTYTASTVASQSNYGFDSGFVELDSIKITANGSSYPLNCVPYAYLDAIDTIGTTGVPDTYATYAEEFRLYPTPDGIYTLTVAYTKELAALSTYASTNAWTTEALNLLVAATKRSLLESAPDEAAQALAARMGEIERRELNVLLAETARRTPSAGLRAHF